MEASRMATRMHMALSSHRYTESMQGRLLLLAAIIMTAAAGQEPCPPTPLYGRCELVFELDAGEAKIHPNPYLSVTLQAEFRSPRHRTFLLPAFHDGGRRLVIR